MEFLDCELHFILTWLYVNTYKKESGKIKQKEEYHVMCKVPLYGFREP